MCCCVVFRSELATEEVLHRARFAWIVKLALRMFTFITHFAEDKVMPYAVLVGPYAFSRQYHFDAFGPQTGTFFLWFSKEIAHGAVRVI